MLFFSILACGSLFGGGGGAEVHAGDDPVFELRGAHAAVSCSSCHGDGEPDSAVPRTCVGCHEEDLPDAHLEPDVDRCGECHNQESWDDVDLDTADPV
jgi:NAD-dependent SIR2 family protein deacetylase